MNIEERAKEYADNFVVGDSAIIVDLLHKVAEESYIKGATEQKAIDDAEHTEEMRKLNEEWKENLEIQRKMLIEKACERYRCELGQMRSLLNLVKKRSEINKVDLVDVEGSIEEFRKALEK